ncbi:MAG: hypothetical protein AAGE52_14195 [Myxococcota bacterium]
MLWIEGWAELQEILHGHLGAECVDENGNLLPESSWKSIIQRHAYDHQERAVFETRVGERFEKGVRKQWVRVVLRFRFVENV